MPDINLPAATGLARQPRAAIKLNGVVVPGWIDMETDSNSYRAADTFKATFAVNDLPVERNLNWIAAQKSITAEIFATTSPADPARYAPVQADRLILGQVDDVSYEPSQGTIHLAGRDLTARLIDTKTSENFSNQTSSQIATTLATRRGLTPVVTATSTRVGTYYSSDHVDVHQELSEWDLLVRVAEFEGFDVYVVGEELHFGPKPPEASDHYAIVWTPPTNDDGFPSLNAITLTLGRSLTIAKGVSVEVRSWHGKSRKAFLATWPKAVKSTKPGQAGTTTQVYRFTVPGKTQDQALQIAQQRYKQIVDNMVTLSADLPGDSILDCTKTVAVRGTGTSFDQTYFPDSVSRTMSMEEGYRMTVTARNISQDVEAAAHG